MAEIQINDIVKLAVDSYKGNVEKYSVAQSNETLRQALVELNNGKTEINYRDIRDGKCSGLFTIVEEILDTTIPQGLQGNEFFMNLVDFRNVREGDSPEFIVEDRDLYVVSDVADGTQGIRRQRLGGSKVATIPTTMKMVRIYEELNRVLSGRVDFNKFIAKVADSFQQKLLNDVYTLWTSATATQLGGATYFPTAGAYDEGALLDVIAHVEAAAGGQPATVVGTAKALRKLHGSITTPSMNNSDAAKESIYNLGYVGHFYGTPVAKVPQRHKVGTTEFALKDDSLTIIAGDDKPIKVVYEGDSIVIMGDPMTNADLTQEYLYGTKMGMGIVLAGNNAGIGRYDFT